MSKFKDLIIDVQDSIIRGELTFKQIADMYGLSYSDVNLIAEDLMDQYDDKDESGLTFFDSEYEERV
jgi:hypothetical protein